MRLILTFITLFFVINYIMNKKTVEKYYGWIPKSTRNTRLMTYDIRGPPAPSKCISKYCKSPITFRLFPFWWISPHHWLADYRAHF